MKGYKIPPRFEITKHQVTQQCIDIGKPLLSYMGYEPRGCRLVITVLYKDMGILVSKTILTAP